MSRSAAIGVVLDPEAPRRGEGDLPAYAAPYVGEVMAHAGVPFDLLVPTALGAEPSPRALLILAQDLDLAHDERARLTAFVRDGGQLIGLAGTSGLDALFGCETRGPLDEGYMVASSTSHPVTDRMRRPVHVFGGSRVLATTGRVLAQVETGAGSEADAIVEHRIGRGRTLLLAPDLITSIVHIQQGTPVVPVPPREWAGSPVSSVLDPERDRDTIEIADVDDLYYTQVPRAPDGRPRYDRRTFLEPMADTLRDLLLRATFDACARAGEPLPVLWYWPRGLDAIAHMSHDSDGNRLGLAWTLFYLMRELDVRTTWCTMPVPGYSRPFYDALKDAGYEIGLHYATGNAPVRTDRRWSQTDFDWQCDMLCYQARIPRIISNKNHGLAWQGRLEFYRWCAARGIQIDQTRGDRGFTFGTCHPWRPMVDGPGGDFLDVLALPFLTQDLTVVCPLGFMRPLADRCHSAHGVAHFLFHPSHIEDPLHERAIRETVAYARQLGMEWWTSAAINAWERTRRQIAIAPAAAGGAARHATFWVRAPEPLAAATLLVLPPATGRVARLTIDGAEVTATTVERYGQRFAQVVADLDGEQAVEVEWG